jgi:hypothetical protein
MTSQRLLIITAIMTILLSAGYGLRERVWAESSPAASSEVPSGDLAEIKPKESAMRFPSATGANLQRKKMTLPADFGGEQNIILVAFEQWQQKTVNTWLPFVEQLEQRFDGVRYYELPVIRRMNFLARTFINEGMRAGIPDAKARDRTITLYLDKQSFRQALGLRHERDIYILIVDRKGNISWRAEGAFTPEKGEALTRAIEARQGQDSPISQLNLEDYRWQNRLILIFAPNSKDETFIAQRRLLVEQPAEAAERDLLIFSLFEEEPGRLNDSSISVAANRDARDRFKVVPGSFAVLLIGKDGGVKLHSRQLVSSGEIFGLIDTMPMRQREMQEQSKANP